jgi:hypothetical protein
MPDGEEPPVGDAAKQFFESQLEGLQFGIDAINRQTLADLWKSLDRIDEAIAKPDGYVVLMTEGAKDAYDMNTVCPVLLERRELIQSRIRELRTRRAAHPESRDAHPESRAEDEGIQLRDIVAIIHAMGDLAERLLTREIAAAIVGGVLAWWLGAAMIVAMFMKVTVSQNVSSAFVIVFGYFFVQGVRRDGIGSKPTDASSLAGGGEQDAAD